MAKPIRQNGHDTIRSEQEEDHLPTAGHQRRIATFRDFGNHLPPVRYCQSNRSSRYLLGFSGHQPLFSLGADGANYSTTRNRALYFGDQSFAASKADDTYRMFFLGGSTVRGRPYAVDSAFAKWVEIELNQRSKKTTYESINCGGLSYASFRLTHINREVLEYDPDLIVIATGHNEFLENRTFEKQSSQAEVRSALESLRLVVWLRSMIGQDVESFKDSSQDALPDNVTARLDSESGYASYNWDPEWVASITAQYESSLEAMIQQCQQANVAIVLVCLGSNLRDCPPLNQSSTRRSLQKHSSGS